MSKCSQKTNEICKKIQSISGLDDDIVYEMLIQLDKRVIEIVNAINKYAEADTLNGTCFKPKEEEN